MGTLAVALPGWLVKLGANLKMEELKPEIQKLMPKNGGVLVHVVILVEINPNLGKPFKPARIDKQLMTLHIEEPGATFQQAWDAAHRHRCLLPAPPNSPWYELRSEWIWVTSK